MKRTWRKYRTKGSMTVEATFLFPMIFFIILAILNMAFYFCDMCKVQGVLDQYAKRQAVCTKEHRSLEKERDYEKIADTGIFWCMADNSQAEAELKAAVKEKIEEKSLVSKVEKVETQVTAQKVFVKVKIKCPLWIGNIKEWVSGVPLEYTLATEIMVHDPAEFVRVYTQLEQINDGDNVWMDILEKLGRIKEAISGQGS